MEKSAFLSQNDWVPESERTGHRRVIGLHTHRSKFFALPDVSKAATVDPATLREIQRQLYWLNFRFSHGALLRNLPRTTKLYVAVPDSRSVSDSLGSEREFFLEYLHEKSRWSHFEIHRRIRFFDSPIEAIWAQDAGEMMLRSKDRLATFYKSSSDYKGYLSFLRALAAAYPSVFAVKELPPEISAEGGDLEVVWGPDRKPALLLGRHRVRHYLESTRKGWTKDRPATRADIEEARAAYSRAFEGLPVHIVPEIMLFHPERASDELFHLDMVVSVMDHHKGPQPHAFVPEYPAGPIYDSLTHKEIPATLVKKWIGEFDATARQMKASGYKVVRLPFSDHPARSPVNFGKYRDEATGEYVVILPKYPYHLPPGSIHTPQFRLQNAAWEVEQMGADWVKAGTPESLRTFRKTIQTLWAVIEEVQAAPSPLFEERSARVREAGYDVIAVPSFAWGAGGVHCQILK